MRFAKILLAVVVVAGSFLLTLKAMDWFPSGTILSPPGLVELPPLPRAPASSHIVVPVAISLSTIRDAAERGAPRGLAGKVGNSTSPLLRNADIAWSVTRGPLVMAGAQGALSLTAPLAGTLRVTGAAKSGASGAVGDALGSLLGGSVAGQMAKGLDTTAEIKGNTVIVARPKLSAAWRIEPNFLAQVTLEETSLSVGGARVKTPTQVKPLIDKTVSDQLDAVAGRIRNDSTFEQAARLQWAKFCRSIRLQGARAGISPRPELWLELRPIHAIAAQPRIDSSAMTATLGIAAETRVTPAQTKPDCPFPATISIVPPTPGGVSIGVPIDLPLTEVSKVIETQLVGRTFPENGSGSVDLTVKRATVAASGERLLISLLLSVKDRSKIFSLRGEANVHIWGRPFLDEEGLTIGLKDIDLSVESKAAFGLLGVAAQAARPYLMKALAERVTIDLKAFVGNARRRIASAIFDLRQNQDGIRVAAEITTIRLADITFDSRTLRVIAKAEGAINVYMTALPGL